MVRAYGEWRNPCVTIGENEVRIRILYMFGSEDAYFNETTTQLGYGWLHCTIRFPKQN